MWLVKSSTRTEKCDCGENKILRCHQIDFNTWIFKNCEYKKNNNIAHRIYKLRGSSEQKIGKFHENGSHCDKEGDYDRNIKEEEFDNDNYIVSTEFELGDKERIITTSTSSDSKDNYHNMMLKRGNFDNNFIVSKDDFFIICDEEK